MEASAKDVKLWWPAGMGKQELYRMNVTFMPKADAAVSTSRRVGFRYFALAAGNVTDTSLVEKEKNEQAEANEMDFDARGCLQAPRAVCPALH